MFINGGLTMFLICSKINNVILSICKKVDYMENGYPIDVYRNIAYPDDTSFVYDVDDVPNMVSEFKYCYTEENGFYKNEKYTEPYMLTEDMYKDILSNIDYLMLLNDPDSTSETVTE